MATLKKDNVVRIVEDEAAKARLISKGFIEIVKKDVAKVVEEVKGKAK
jgi:F0F1-type ATP synthase epsilon subunit